MSTPTDRLHDPNRASFYALTGARTVRLGQVSEAATALAATRAPEQFYDAGEPFEEPVNHRPRRSRRPELLPVLGPPLLLRTRSWLTVVGRLVVIVLAAAFVAFVALIAIALFPFPGLWHQPGQDRTIEFASSASRPAPSIATEPSGSPRLIVQDSRAKKGDSAPLGMAMQGPADGAIVMITGLVAGMTLSMGGAVGTEAWQVHGSNLGNTWIHPPKDFVGSAELVAELRLADNTIADRRTIHWEWMPPPAPAQHPAISDQEKEALFQQFLSWQKAQRPNAATNR
jgi:hypothetical protein